MQITTDGSVRRLDLGPARALAPALWAEWDGLRFASSGEAVDPLTGGSRTQVRLVAGHHRQPGASYVVTLPPPPPPAGAPRRRRRRDPVPEPTELHIGLHRDDGREVSVTITDPAGHWSADVVVRRERLPRVEVTARADLPAIQRDQDRSGCAAGLLGSGARLHATVDGDTLDRGGDLLAISMRTSRFRLRAQAAVAARGPRWEGHGHLTLRGRGLGRVVLTVGRARLRRALDEEARSWWAGADQWAAEREAELARLATDVADAGGPEPFVRRAVWDPTFRPPSVAGWVGPQPATRTSREATTAATKRSRTAGGTRSRER
ncbi:MAG TPA: hypothetical protein VK507_18550 [Iamia sp.]|nr:hypothetical protein [Iamia sp.]